MIIFETYFFVNLSAARSGLLGVVKKNMQLDTFHTSLRIGS